MKCVKISTCTSSLIDVVRFAIKSTIFERWNLIRCWWFVFCLTDKDECMYFPCKHGGTCVNNDGSYQCICPPGFTGPTCDLGNFVNHQIVKLLCMYSCICFPSTSIMYVLCFKALKFSFLISWFVNCLMLNLIFFWCNRSKWMWTESMSEQWNL